MTDGKQVLEHPHVYETLLLDAYERMSSREKNPSGLWRRSEDAEVVRLGKLLENMRRTRKLNTWKIVAQGMHI